MFSNSKKKYLILKFSSASTIKNKKDMYIEAKINVTLFYATSKKTLKLQDI